MAIWVRIRNNSINSRKGKLGWMLGRTSWLWGWLSIGIPLLGSVYDQVRQALVWDSLDSSDPALSKAGPPEVPSRSIFYFFFLSTFAGICSFTPAHSWVAMYFSVGTSTRENTLGSVYSNLGMHLHVQGYGSIFAAPEVLLPSTSLKLCGIDRTFMVGYELYETLGTDTNHPV